MGLFDRSKQVTTTTNNISSTDISNTTSNVMQDSGNVVTSITDAFKNSVSWVDQSTFSQPIAIMGGGASDSGFDANKFFDSANAVAGKESGAQKTAQTFGKIALVAFALWVVVYFWKRKK